MLRVAILGPGAVGGLIAAALRRAGNDVVLIAREAAVEDLQRRGLEVRSVRFGDFHADVRVEAHLDESVDCCFVTLKATHLEAGLRSLTPEVLGQALLIPLLNGIDHMDILRARFPARNVVAGTIRVESYKTEDGTILQTSPFATIELAQTPSTHDRVTSVADHLKAAGFDVRIRDDEAAMLWEKLAFLGPLALLTTIDQSNAGRVRTDRRAEAEAAISEMTAVAAADGVTLAPDALLRLLDSIPSAMATSMSKDAAAGRPIELDAIGGAVIRKADRARIAVPVTRRLVAQLRAREEKNSASAD
jgi:2-dehydropantoate 2-reductase